MAEHMQSFYWSLYTRLLSVLRPSIPGQKEENPIVLTAVPGLMTFLDVALFRSVEGQLTATICSSHALLWAWIDVKKQAKVLLGVLGKEDHQSVHHKMYDQLDSFARLCLEAACDAVERLSIDKLAQSANLSDPYDFNSGSHALSGVGSQGIVNGVLDGKNETGRRQPIQRRRDCWESPRLLCPDYVWADDAYLTCQKLMRNLYKHTYYVADVESFSASREKRLTLFSATCDKEVSLLFQLLRDDLPVRMHQFKAAMEADSAVTKRLYLIKCEYRAPFRAFLEAHQSVQRAPSLELVDHYLKLHADPVELERTRDAAKSTLKNLLATPALVDSLLLEQRCEEMELEMAKVIFPFSELARILDHRRAHLKAVPNVLELKDVYAVEETVRRLKSLLCRKAGAETSGGIRPLLLDLQGVPHDDRMNPVDYLLLPDGGKQLSKENARAKRIDNLIKHLKCLGELCKTRSAFHTERKTEVDTPMSIVKGCTTEFDDELFRCQFLDWYDMAARQHELSKETSFDELADTIRRAEMENSVAATSSQSLNLVRQRLEVFIADRETRFDVLQELVEEICRREMNLFVKLKAPDKMLTLELPETSAKGLFGVALQLAGEPLPVG